MRLRVIHQYLSQRKKIETVIIECSGEERTASSRELTLIREHVTRCAANYKNCYKWFKIQKNAFSCSLVLFLKKFLPYYNTRKVGLNYLELCSHDSSTPKSHFSKPIKRVILLKGWKFLDN